MRNLTGTRLRQFSLCIGLMLTFCVAVNAQAANSTQAYIAIIIDDLGVNWAAGLKAIRLPGPVALSIIPNQTFSTQLAQHAHGRRKDVILHLPMEPRHYKELLPAGGLRVDMSEQEIYQALENGLASVPHAIAINNHMGSAFTSRKKAMSRLMAAVHEQNPDLFFIDSLTTNKSVVKRQAAEHGIPSLARSVFLDNERTEKAIEQQFDALVAIAKKHGGAIAIGHPYPETMAVLQRRLAPLFEGEVRLIPITMLLAMKVQEREPWR